MMLRHPGPALAVAATLALAACGGGDDDDADATTTTGASTTTAPTTTAPATPDADEAARDGEQPPTPTDNTEVLPPPCPRPATAPVLEPADAGATPFPPEGSGLEPGRYTTDVLGLSFALDVPDLFDDAGAFGRAQGLFGGFGDRSIGLLRPDAVGFVTDLPSDEEFARGAEIETVDFETWLAQPGIEIVDDAIVTVADREARRLRIATTEEAVTRFGDVPLTTDWNIQPTDEESLLVNIDVGTDEPFLLAAQSLSGVDGFDDAIQSMIDSLAIGGVGPTLQTVFGETPWDIGNIFRPELVGAGCTVPALAFGGVEFELASTSRIQGQGDELWIFDTSGQFAGLREPYVHLVAPEFTLLGGATGPPRPGDPVETIDDALAEFEEEGFELTPRDEEVSLLGATADSYDFVGPTVEPWLWFPRNNGVSDGFGFISGEPNRAGVIHVAETSVGVVVATLEGEAGTDDAAILRERFDRLLETLRPSEER